MVQIVEFQGEEIEFPDNMADADIEAVLLREASGAQPVSGVTEQPIEPSIAQDQPGITQPKVSQLSGRARRAAGLREQRIASEALQQETQELLRRFEAGEITSQDLTPDQVEQVQNARIESLPEISEIGLQGLSENTTFLDAVAGLTAFDPEEFAQILQKSDPRIGISRTPEGELIAVNNETGQAASVNKIGPSLIDALQLGGSIAAFATPVAAGRTLTAQALGSAATQAAIETGQVAAGGEFDVGEVALAGAAPIVVGKALQQAKALRPTVTKADDVIAARAASVVDDADTAANEAIKTKAAGAEVLSDVDQSIVPELQDYEEISQALKRQKLNKAATQVLPDDQIIKAADDLGVDLNPDAFSTNRAFKEVVQSLKSRPGSTLSAQEEKSIIQLGERADDLIADIGGTTDKSLLDATVKAQVNGSIDDLSKRAEPLYNNVEAVIPAAVKVKPLASRQFIDKAVKDLGGDKTLLSAAEKDLLRITAKNPTYTALDRLRKKVGAGFTGKGPFKDEQEGILRQVYKVLSEDQQGVSDAFGIGADYATARKLVASRKQLEDQAIKLFGRDLSGSIVPKLTQAATKLTKGDVSDFNKLINALPENRRGDAVATMLNDVFTSGARSKKTGVGQGFKDAFQNLNRNKEAKNLLFKHLPQGSRERFDKIGVVATGIFNAKALENTSKTARDVISAMNDSSMFGKLYDVGTKAVVAEGVSTGLGLPGAGTAAVIGSALTKTKTVATEAADKLLTSQKFKDAVIQATRGNEAAANKLTKSPEFKRWVKLIKPEEKARISSIGFINWLIERPELQENQ